MKKLAVFITGPKRYTSLVIDNLAIILKDIDYDNFIFVWNDDLSNMKRSSEYYNQEEIQNDPKTKVLINHRPYGVKYIDERYGKQVLGHSSKNAMIGMFYSINTLCSIIKTCPDEGEYSHILRVRTDCLIYSSDWLGNYKNNEILVADNPLNPSSWVSNHFMLAPKDAFLKIWSFKDTQHINSRFKFSANNPEVLISQRMLKYKYNKAFRRFLDYQIVYTEHKKNDVNFSSDICNNLYAYFNLQIIPSYDNRFSFYNSLSKIRYKNERGMFKKISSHPYCESLKSFVRKYID